MTIKEEDFNIDNDSTAIDTWGHNSKEGDTSNNSLTFSTSMQRGKTRADSNHCLPKQEGEIEYNIYNSPAESKHMLINNKNDTNECKGMLSYW